MRIETRPATEEDRGFTWLAYKNAYEDVVRRQFGAWEDEPQERRFDEKWAAGGFEVVEFGGERAGAIWTTEEEDHFRLHEVFLHPDYQDRGIGTLLVTQVISRARDHGKPLRLRVLRESRARRLYERLGFLVVGETEAQYGMEAH